MENFSYIWPRPALTVDIILLEGRRILLVSRKNEPFKGKWALPGGFVEKDEPLLDACLRELREETGLTEEVEGIEQSGTWGTPGRDPRGWTVTVVFLGFVLKEARKIKLKPSDDAIKAQWFDKDKLPRMAFDHKEIIRASLAREANFKGK